MAGDTPLWCIVDSDQPYSTNVAPPNSPDDLEILESLLSSVSFRSCSAVSLKNRGLVSAFVQKLVDESAWETLELLQSLTIWASNRNSGLMRYVYVYFAALSTHAL